MKTTFRLALGLVLLSALNTQLFAQGTAFTYQGRLNDNGSPANGSYDLTFSLFVNSSGPPQLGNTVTNLASPVSGGVFTVTLEFGANFPGADRFLEIGVRTNGSSAFTALAPRQQILPTPYAIYSAGAASATRATNFSGELAGDVTGTQGATLVARVGGQTAANVASGAIAANAATNANMANTIVKRDGSGNFSAGVISFGLADDGNIGKDPTYSGLIERDPVGSRLMGTNNQGGRLLFGPTTNSIIEVQSGSNAVAGLLLRDPSGIRLHNPSSSTNRLLFGSTDSSRIESDPNAGMRFSDVRGFTFSSQVVVNGPIFAQAFIQTSSRRFKHDVRPIEQPLEKISELQGVRFAWNEEKGGREDIGFIAEDVAKAIPELVSWEDDGQNARGVNYDHLVAVAIEGIKAQQTQIQTLKSENANLKQSVAELKAIVSELVAEKREAAE